MGVGVFLLIAHVTSTLNSWWPMGGGWEGWGSSHHCSCHFNSQLQMTNGRWVDGVLLLNVHVTSTPTCWWSMGVGGLESSPHCSCHFNSQLLMINGVWGWGSSPHCSCHFNSQLLMTNGKWVVGGGVLLLIAHVTSALNSWWPMGSEGGYSPSLLMSLQLTTPDDQWGDRVGCSSSLLMSLQISTPDDQWDGRVGTPPHCSCHFNSQLLMINGVTGWGAPPHCSCHFKSQLLMTNGMGGWVLLLIAHVTSTLYSW